MLPLVGLVALVRLQVVVLRLVFGLTLVVFGMSGFRLMTMLLRMPGCRYLISGRMAALSGARSSGVCFGGAAVYAHVTVSWGLFCSHFGRVGPSHDFSAEDARRRLPDLPDVWTDGSLVGDEITGACFGGAGVCAHVSGSAWFHRRWGHLDLLLADGEIGAECCGLFLLCAWSPPVCSRGERVVRRAKF